MKKNLTARKTKRLTLFSPTGLYPVNLHVNRLPIAVPSEVVHTDKNNHFKK